MGVLLLAGCSAPPVGPSIGSGPSGSGPSGSAAVGGQLPVAVVVGTDLISRDGQRTSLAWAGDRVRAYEVPAGLLVVGADAWLVTPDGAPHPLGSDVDGFAVAPTGDRLAYLSGERLTIVTVAVPTRTVATTTGVKSLSPNRFLDGSVLLTHNDPGGATDAYDVWNPDQGPYRPSPPAQIHQLAGSTPDGHTILAAVPKDGGLCFSRLSPVRSFALQPGPCHAGLTLDGGVWPISPDGRWLLARGDGTKEDGNPVILVDLSASGPAGIAGAWPDRPARSLSLYEGVWLDARTAVVGGQGGVARLTVTTVGVIDWYPIPGDLPVVPVPSSRGSLQPFPASTASGRG